MNAAVMERDQMDSAEYGLFQSGNKRSNSRFATRLKALYYYYVSAEHEGLEQCEIVNVSYGGVGIQFNQAKAFKDSLAINLGVVVKWQLVPINLKGRVKWLSEGTSQPVGGVELDVPLDNMTLLKLL
jgi:hypothetical protein